MTQDPKLEPSATLVSNIPQISVSCTRAVIGTTAFATVGFLALLGALLSAACRPYLVLTEYILTDWVTWLLSLATAGLAGTLVIQFVVLAGVEPSFEKDKAIRHRVIWHVGNITFCVFVLMMELLYCSAIGDYFFSAVRELSPECQRNAGDLVWEPPSHGFLWQIGHGAWFNLHHEGPLLRPTEVINRGYEYPRPQSSAMPPTIPNR